jgi:hypothetical protein
VAGTATVAASAGIQKVGISGNAGASVDAVLGAAIPLNAILIGGSDGTDLRALATDTSGRQEVVGAAGSGSAVAGNPVLVGGSDGTDARTLLTDNTGQLKVLVENGSAIATTDLANGSVTAGTAASKSELIGGVYTATPPTLTSAQQIAAQFDTVGSLYVNNEGRKATYSAQVNGIAIIAGNNFFLLGSASKTIRITKLIVSGNVPTTATNVIVAFQICSAPTGGTSSTSGLTIGTYDSNNPAVSATAKYYTAAPTGGATTQTFLDVLDYTLGAPAAVSAPYIANFGQRSAQCPTIRGTSQAFCLFFGSAPSSSAYTFTIEWTEE